MSPKEEHITISTSSRLCYHILQSGVDINSKDEHGWTGLMQAMKFNSVVEFLLKTPNIEVNQKDIWGLCRPLSVTFLIRTSGNLTAKQARLGSCALYLAVSKRNIEALKLLPKH